MLIVRHANGQALACSRRKFFELEAVTTSAGQAASGKAIMLRLADGLHPAVRFTITGIRRGVAGASTRLGYFRFASIFSHPHHFVAIPRSLLGLPVLPRHGRRFRPVALLD
jgi:hypothetical protein